MSIPSWAVPGAKVVCVKEGPWRVVMGSLMRHERVPVFGHVYTIRRTAVLLGVEFCELEEFPSVGAGLHRFRPVVNDTTEATLFRAKHQPARLRETEPA